MIDAFKPFKPCSRFWHTCLRSFFVLLAVQFCHLGASAINMPPDYENMPMVSCVTKYSCPSGQSLTDINNHFYCVANNNGKCYTAESYNPCDATAGYQNQEADSSCSTCGYYPTSKCPPSCESGQTLTQISGNNYCVDNQNGMCYGIISYSSGQAKQSVDANCSACGYYPTSKCPPSCESGQTLTQISGKNYCVDNQNGMCYGTISYSSGQAKQSIDANCSPCGIYPTSKCPPFCKSGQEKKDINGKTYCVASDGTCYGMATYSSSGQIKQQPDASCSSCGKYPANECPPYCSNNQALMNANGKTFCVEKTSSGLGGACYTAMTSFNTSQSAFDNYGSTQPCTCECGYYGTCDSAESSCPPQRS